ncbi:succinate dehydrogenase cytochrome b558 subunit [Hazenella sp. IB182357]|uniref:Succinate dehydrogenase cytochrome b558 subunit n=1 Tax=Polycladospora coralii TaxID=2771432 RepID=A0A926RUF2_9BACL|nr:succinate dehydrogenase cytochrome b558 subunit [Polycladospora coralii]MBD1372898.1 succinate dehydrogenase cytochrome b558 subunit [Polycladospora coralii]
MGTKRSFFNRRLHSLLGVIPVGFFLVEHLFVNYKATEGAQAFTEQVEWLWGMPFLTALEIFGIFLPLMYHGIYGLYIAFQAKNNVNNFGTFRNYMFMLQRVTGVITLVFVMWHLWETRIYKEIHNLSAADLTEHMASILSNPIVVVIYIIAIIAAVFHFSNGMWSFLVSWGITIGPRAQRVSTYVWAVVFVMVSYLGVSAVIAFADPSFATQLAQ